MVVPPLAGYPHRPEDAELLDFVRQGLRHVRLSDRGLDVRPERSSLLGRGDYGLNVRRRIGVPRLGGAATVARGEQFVFGQDVRTALRPRVATGLEKIQRPRPIGIAISSLTQKYHLGRTDLPPEREPPPVIAPGAASIARR